MAEAAQRTWNRGADEKREHIGGCPTRNTHLEERELRTLAWLYAKFLHDPRIHVRPSESSDVCMSVRRQFRKTRGTIQALHGAFNVTGNVVCSWHAHHRAQQSKHEEKPHRERFGASFGTCGLLSCPKLWPVRDHYLREKEKKTL